VDQDSSVVGVLWSKSESEHSLACRRVAEKRVAIVADEKVFASSVEDEACGECEQSTLGDRGDLPAFGDTENFILDILRDID
jgi:hypothetical protein